MIEILQGQQNHSIDHDFPLLRQSVATFESLSRKAIVATDAEVEGNARSRSAKLRAIRKKAGVVS